MPQKVRSCRVIGASAIHAQCMNELTKDAFREIEQIHSNWIEYEADGDNHSLIALCADDIELWPPDAQPLLGRAAVSAQMARGMTITIHFIEITDFRIRGSNKIAYLTASYGLRIRRPKTRPPDKPLEAICGCCESGPVRGRYSRELVSVWSCRHFRDKLAPSIPSTGVTSWQQRCVPQGARVRRVDGSSAEAVLDRRQGKALRHQ
jgi:ketosteroid isomerase-like protein